MRGLKCVLGEWVNPHREKQTIPQGQTSRRAQICPHANGQGAPDQAALATIVRARGATRWPLQDIADTNCVWCMAFKRGVGGGSCIAQSSCNRIAIVWAMQIGRGKKRMIRSCIKALK